MKCGAIALLLFGTAPALADPSAKVLMQEKQWDAEILSYDDGTFACLAQVDLADRTFTIWSYPDRAVRLQFYAPGWDFGADHRVRYEVAVDAGPARVMTAQAFKNSILFDVPTGESWVDFLYDVTLGRVLYLRDAAGAAAMDYPLAGSGAALAALIQCGAAIAG